MFSKLRDEVVLGAGMAIALCTALSLFPAVTASGAANEGDTVVTVRGPGAVAVALSVADLKALPAVTVAVTTESGAAASYTGVPLHKVLERALGTLAPLKGPRMTDTVIVSAADGYRVTYARAEIDPEFFTRDILLCFARDGMPMDDKEGPLRVVAVGENRHARWIRRVTALELRAEGP